MTSAEDIIEKLVECVQDALPTLDDCEQDNREKGGPYKVVANAFKRQSDHCREVVEAAKEFLLAQ